MMRVMCCIWWLIFKINLFELEYLFLIKIKNNRNLSLSVNYFLKGNYFLVWSDCMLFEKCFEGKVVFVIGGGIGLGKGMVKMLFE